MSAHAEPLGFSPRRIAAMVLRYWYLLRSSWPRLLELIYWPAVQMLMWGFLQLYIAGNAGFEGAVVVARIRGESDAMGFNAATGEWGDLRMAGIIDPAKVTRSALQNAASIAALVLTTECAIAEKPDRDAQVAGEYGGMQ